MHAGQARRLHQQLHVIRDSIPGVVCAGDRLSRDFEQAVDPCLVDTDGRRKGRETGVRGVARLIDDVDVEVFELVVEQCLKLLSALCGWGCGARGGVRTAEKGQNLEASTRSTATAASCAGVIRYTSYTTE